MGHIYDCYQNKLKELIDNKDVVGILLVGKGALADEKSFEDLNDVDLIVITSTGEKNRRSVAAVETVEFDMSYLPVSFVEDALERLDVLWIEILANSKIVYSVGIDHLVDACRKIWQEGPPALREIDKEYWSFYLTSSMEDIRNRLGDEAMAKYLMTEFLTSVMRILFKLNRKFEPLKKKRWLGQIKNLSPAIGHQIESILVTEGATNQFVAVEALYNEVVSFLGGPCSTWTHEEFPEDR